VPYFTSEPETLIGLGLLYDAPSSADSCPFQSRLYLRLRPVYGGRRACTSTCDWNRSRRSSDRVLKLERGSSRSYWRTETVTVWLHALKLLWLRSLGHLQPYRQKTR